MVEDNKTGTSLINFFSDVLCGNFKYSTNTFECEFGAVRKYEELDEEEEEEKVDEKATERSRK